jgi:hypothetical protein
LRRADGTRIIALRDGRKGCQRGLRVASYIGICRKKLPREPDQDLGTNPAEHSPLVVPGKGAGQALMEWSRIIGDGPC